MESWCSLVNTLPCQGRDREFESRRLRHLNKIPAERRDFFAIKFKIPDILNFTILLYYYYFIHPNL